MSCKGLGMLEPREDDGASRWRQPEPGAHKLCKMLRLANEYSAIHGLRVIITEFENLNS